MNEFPVIGMVGLQASGKTVVASHLASLGAKRVRMGNIVWRKVEQRGLEVNEENVGKVANELREKEGMGAVAKRCIPIIQERGKENPAIVVDGIRGIAEVEVFKDKFDERFVLISIEASKETRYKRIKDRKREDDSLDLEAFEEKENRELNWGLKEAMESADYKIENEGTLDELKEKTSKVYEGILEEYES